MRFSGFSFRLGKRTRLYFSNSKKPSRSAKRKKSPPEKQSAPARTASQSVDYTPSMAVGIIFVVIGAIFAAIGLFFVLAAFAHTGLSRVLSAIVAFFCLAFGINVIMESCAEIKRAKAHKAEMAAAAEAQVPEYKTVPILLELDMSPKHQQTLKDLKLKIATSGLHGNLVLQQDDNLISVLVNDSVLGKVSTADALWIDRCFSYIDKLTSFKIVGGGRDTHGEEIPFMVVVELSIHNTAPDVPSERSFDLPDAGHIWGMRSDLVCYISRTGTAHHRLGSCNIGADWTPMFLYEAEEAGYTPCSKCFH